MIPPCVPEVMEELGLIGMRIQRMPSDGDFGDPSTYPYLTVIKFTHLNVFYNLI